MIDRASIDELDGEGTAAFIAERHRALVEAEAELAYATLHFADVHNGDAVAGTGEVLPGMERSRRLGSPGTPRVREFAHTELAALQEMSTRSGATMIGDVQDLAFRLPRMWGLVCSGRARVWKGRKVAAWTRHLDLEQARWVDQQVAGWVDSLPFGRFENLVRAKIIEVDPAGEEARRKAAEAERFVRTGQSNDQGLKTLVAKASAGDVIYFVAMVDRIALILAANGDPESVGVRRSKAIGILANPARALKLIEDFELGLIDVPEGDAPPPEASGDEDDGPEGDDSSAGAGGGQAGDDEEDPKTVGEGDVHPADNDADDPAPQQQRCPACAGSGTMTGGPSPFTRPMRVDPSKLLPPATLYVHLSEASWRDPTSGVARFEGFGPISVQQAREFLGRNCQVTVKGVIDVAGQSPVDGYETPARIVDALHLRSPADIFPFGVNLGRRKDSDHTVEYVSPDNGGPPGQTSMGNTGLIVRFHHRVKTHGRWRLKQPEPGMFLWRSPHGWIFLVDHNGTHRLGNSATAQEFWSGARRNNAESTAPKGNGAASSADSRTRYGSRGTVTVELVPAGDDPVEYEPAHVA
ncbi:MAG TPA: hypothetical protein VJ819_03200 [Nocardioidaceae bacterium]|nr:hypothetical protein [Nocardioidaceae bacterium]